MLEKSSSTDNQLSKEDYLIMRAKKAMPMDIYAAKSWLITARSLFPHSAKVQVSTPACPIFLIFSSLFYTFLLFFIYISEVIYSEKYCLYNFQ